MQLLKNSQNIEKILLLLIKNKKKEKNYGKILKEANEQINNALTSVLMEVGDEKN